MPGREAERWHSSWGYCSVTELCLTLCDPMDCSTPGFPVLRHLPEFAQTHVHWVDEAIQPSHPLYMTNTILEPKLSWPFFLCISLENPWHFCFKTKQKGLTFLLRLSNRSQLWPFWYHLKGWEITTYFSEFKNYPQGHQRLTPCSQGCHHCRFSISSLLGTGIWRTTCCFSLWPWGGQPPSRPVKHLLDILLPIYPLSFYLCLYMYLNDTTKFSFYTLAICFQSSLLDHPECLSDSRY